MYHDPYRRYGYDRGYDAYPRMRPPPPPFHASPYDRPSYPRPYSGLSDPFGDRVSAPSRIRPPLVTSQFPSDRGVRFGGVEYEQERSPGKNTRSRRGGSQRSSSPPLAAPPQHNKRKDKEKKEKGKERRSNRARLSESSDSESDSDSVGKERRAAPKPERASRAQRAPRAPRAPLYKPRQQTSASGYDPRDMDANEDGMTQQIIKDGRVWVPKN